jgi:hypothetical protein
MPVFICSNFSVQEILSMNCFLRLAVSPPFNHKMDVMPSQHRHSNRKKRENFTHWWSQYSLHHAKFNLHKHRLSFVSHKFYQLVILPSFCSSVYFCYVYPWVFKSCSTIKQLISVQHAPRKLSSLPVSILDVFWKILVIILQYDCMDIRETLSQLLIPILNINAYLATY